MTRHVHWTRDPRYRRLRNPPAWYHRQVAPVYVPRPSARMERQAAEERKRQWLWQKDGADSADDAGDDSPSYLEAACWPCGAYARVMERLNSALGGRDAVDIRKPPFCVPDCLEYGLCLPFYGVILAKVQTTVRSFYDIDGSSALDLRDGCCCPCRSIVRLEQEIIIREKQHARLGSPEEDGPVVHQYSPSSGMPVPIGKADEKAKAKANAKSPKSPKSPKPMSTIAEATLEPAEGPSRSKEPGRIDDDDDDKPPRLPKRKTYHLLQYLGKPWHAAPAARDTQPEATQLVSLSTALKSDENLRPLSVKSNPELKPSGGPHHLEDDALADRTSRFAEHLLETDAVLSRAPPLSDGHQLDSHAMSNVGGPSTPHGLHDDKPLSVGRSNAGGSHSLNEDTPAPLAARRAQHQLDSHEPIKTPVKEVVHHLEEHPQVPGGVSSQAHGLEEH